jgi:hypothetical protein
MKKILFVMVAALLVVACKKGDDAGTTSTTSSGDSIGVKECDDYVTKYEACIDKMGPAAKTAAEPGFKAQRDAFKQAASTAAGKAALATQCKTAMDAIKSTCP